MFPAKVISPQNQNILPISVINNSTCVHIFIRVTVVEINLIIFSVCFCAGAIRRDLWKRCSGREQKITRKLQEVVAGGNDLAHGCRGRITHCTETPVRIRKTEDPNTPTASFRHPATMKELKILVLDLFVSLLLPRNSMFTSHVPLCTVD